MNEVIQKRILELGGIIERPIPNSFQQFWGKVTFIKPLYKKDWDFDITIEYYLENKQAYEIDEEIFYENLLDVFYSETPKGQDFFQKWLFTPFNPGTGDHEEFQELLNEVEIRKVVSGRDLEFICIIHSYGYPDHFFVCTSDPNQNNPTVYSTDHEQYFDKINNEGPLQEVLSRYLTVEEHLGMIKNHIKEYRTEKIDISWKNKIRALVKSIFQRRL